VCPQNNIPTAAEAQINHQQNWRVDGLPLHYHNLNSKGQGPRLRLETNLIAYTQKWNII